MSDSILQKLIHKSKEVETALEIFKNDYKNSVEENIITNIISGESIQTKPENISIHSGSSAREIDSSVA